MNWTNIRLIWMREVRDQLRDRRTIFTIAVLPLLLYPLLGMSFMQVTQFMREHPTQIWLIGQAALPAEPALLDSNPSSDEPQFSEDFCTDRDNKLLELTVQDAMPVEYQALEPRSVAQREIQQGEFDAVVYFPADFAERLEEFRQRLRQDHQQDNGELVDLQMQVPQPEIFVNMASDKSRIAYQRVDRVLDRWRRAIVRQNLESRNIPIAATEPFQVTETDVSEAKLRRAAIWSKILPFVVLIWALTGAFYPAVDLCAGEKERGTLETLLCSPAERSEIVWGKLLTVITFSAATSLLNLASMGATGTFIIRQIKGIGEANIQMSLGPPPLAAIGWLLLAIIPIAALFSALALAIAAFARSSKEGQYYLMPLLLITLPLMILPMLPAAELDLGYSLIPVTGVMLWLRSLIEGEFVEAARYAVPVIGMTAACCWLAIRWAVRQFEDESVLFRESERFGLGLWMRHMVRDREDIPSVAEALFCGVFLLLITFFASMQAKPPTNWIGFAQTVLTTQIALIAGPVLIMSVMLTRSPRRTLKLQWPRWLTLPGAILLAITLHPAVMLLGEGIQSMYPMGEETLAALENMMKTVSGTPLPYVLLIIAVAPAICEELAFRGFILSGLSNLRSKWTAIAISSVFFGLTHGLLQQSIAAAAVGFVIGYVAVQTGSLLPGILFHCAHNSLSVISGRITPELVEQYPILDYFLHNSDVASLGYTYNWPYIIASSLVAVLLLAYFSRLTPAGTSSR